MPALNQRGPMGEGPMTGRKMGRCTNFRAAFKEKDSNYAGEQHEPDNEDIPGRAYGYGYGRGMRGRGRGLGRMNRLRGRY
ncbi:MAG TPA: DUF5320 domain-containing protein [Bacteroidales bacterium]|nr:DUF5320 domain-containing protein [Bacteroidales bacterium]